MLNIEGAVEADWPDEGVAAHYGDPMGEQRAMTRTQVLVDRSNRGVLRITGPDRLTWLHSLTSQDLERLAPGSTAQALILSPQGHLEHHLTLTDDGTAVWVHVEPGTAPALAAYLDSMRFMLRVEVEDLSGVLAVQTLAGPLGLGGDGGTGSPPMRGGVTGGVVPPGASRAFRAPRILNTPVTWRCSSLSATGRPSTVARSTGVCRT